MDGPEKTTRLLDMEMCETLIDKHVTSIPPQSQSLRLPLTEQQAPRQQSLLQAELLQTDLAIRAQAQRRSHLPCLRVIGKEQIL